VDTPYGLAREPQCDAGTTAAHTPHLESELEAMGKKLIEEGQPSMVSQFTTIGLRVAGTLAQHLGTDMIFCNQLQKAARDPMGVIVYEDACFALTTWVRPE
jgi:hypothetical protein